MQQLPVACWDSDFLFDNEASLGSSTTTAVESCRRSVSGTNEDWDMEILVGEREIGVLQHEKASIVPSKGIVTEHEQKKSIAANTPSPVESLLEYLDGHNSEFNGTHRPLPRQPILFSAYIAYQRQRERVDDVTCKSCPGVKDHRISPLIRLHMSSSESAARSQLGGNREPGAHAMGVHHNSANPAFILSPHAPESGKGTIAWLQNLCYKVSHTSAVVARPSPELLGSYHRRERLPDEEASLESVLRAAEMAYCNRDWRDCGMRTKALLGQLEGVAIGPHSTEMRAISLGVGPGTRTLDDDLRCHQCCGRLARLVCRIVQRQDELCTANFLSARRMKKRLGILDNRADFDMPPISAGDIAAFRRGAAALIHDIHDTVLQAKSKLIFDEALVHLSLAQFCSASVI